MFLVKKVSFFSSRRGKNPDVLFYFVDTYYPSQRVYFLTSREELPYLRQDPKFPVSR